MVLSAHPVRSGLSRFPGLLRFHMKPTTTTTTAGGCQCRSRMSTIAPSRPGLIPLRSRTTTTTATPTRPFLTSLLPSPPSIFPSSTPTPSSPSPSSSQLQTVTVSSTLPHPVSRLFGLIADISAYHTFVPYCTHSSISHWSGPDPVLGRSWPAQASLVVGWAGIQEEYSSRVYCVPGRAASSPSSSTDAAQTETSASTQPEWIVEAVAGLAETDLDRSAIGHYASVSPDSSASAPSSHPRTPPGTVFSHMITRWSLAPVPSASQSGLSPSQSPARTRVRLTIRFAFSNPIYTLMSGPVLPKVSDAMMAAFSAHADASLR